MLPASPAGSVLPAALHTASAALSHPPAHTKPALSTQQIEHTSADSPKIKHGLACMHTHTPCPPRDTHASSACLMPHPRSFSRMQQQKLPKVSHHCVCTLWRALHVSLQQSPVVPTCSECSCCSLCTSSAFRVRSLACAAAAISSWCSSSSRLALASAGLAALLPASAAAAASFSSCSSWRRCCRSDASFLLGRLIQSIEEHVVAESSGNRG
jgi:hypothetical protein